MTIAPYELDVRPLLANGVEPFQAIMSALDSLQPKQSLLLIAPFKPVPLFAVLERRGFQANPEPIGDGAWKVLFSPIVDPAPDVQISQNADEAMSWPDPSEYLDCTDMDPPEPMVAILSKLEEMQSGSVLFAAIHREPLFLFPELENRGHQWVGGFDESGETYRMMIRVGKAEVS